VQGLTAVFAHVQRSGREEGEDFSARTDADSRTSISTETLTGSKEAKGEKQQEAGALAAARPLTNSPLALSPRPGLVSAKACTVSGGALSVATAGLVSVFRVTARDRFGNVRGSGDDVFAAELRRFAQEQRQAARHVQRQAARQEQRQAARQELRRFAQEQRQAARHVQHVDLAHESSGGDASVGGSVASATDGNGTGLGYYDASYLVTTAGWWTLQVLMPWC
jgi:hypothetical protein